MMQRITLRPGMAANTQPIKTPRLIHIFEGEEQPGGRADKIKQTHILPPQKLTFNTKRNTTQINTAIETVTA